MVAQQDRTVRFNHGITLAAAALFLVVSGCDSSGASDPVVLAAGLNLQDIEGEWAVIQYEFDDGSVTVLPDCAWTDIRHTFNTADPQNLTMRVETFIGGWEDPGPIADVTIPFTTDPLGNLVFDDGERTLKLACSFTNNGNTLTLTRTSYSGSYPLGPDSPREEGGSSEPGSAPLPPTKVILERVQ